MSFHYRQTATTYAAAASAPHLEFSCTSDEPDEPRPAARDETQASTVTDALAPDLTDYDILLVNSSGGKDSQASLDVVVEHARAAGIVDRIVVVHADLGDAEWDGVPQLAAEHAAHYSLRFELIGRTHADGRTETILERVAQRGMWPDAAAAGAPATTSADPFAKS